MISSLLSRSVSSNFDMSTSPFLLKIAEQLFDFVLRRSADSSAVQLLISYLDDSEALKIEDYTLEYIEDQGKILQVTGNVLFKTIPETIRSLIDNTTVVSQTLTYSSIRLKFFFLFIIGR